MEDLTSLLQPLYDVRLAIVATSDFGYSLQALISRSPPLPPSGARFDVAFDGTVEGPRLSGTISGVDYAHVRADGRMELHIHGRVVTSDGAPLSFSGGGVAIPDPSTGLLRMYESATLHTSDPRYLWVNGLPIWGTGTIDIARGEIRVTGFTSAASLGNIGGPDS